MRRNLPTLQPTIRQTPRPRTPLLTPRHTASAILDAPNLEFPESPANGHTPEKLSRQYELGNTEAIIQRDYLECGRPETPLCCFPCFDVCKATRHRPAELELGRAQQCASS